MSLNPDNLNTPFEEMTNSLNNASNRDGKTVFKDFNTDVEVKGHLIFSALVLN